MDEADRLRVLKSYDILDTGPEDAFDDVIHLSDGPTGAELGRELAQVDGVSVIYVTADPGMLRDGVAGTIGVLCKPTDEVAVQNAVEYALRRREGRAEEPGPPELRLFGA